MALYISAGRRRRTTIMVGVAAAIVGLLLGFLLGRGTTTTIDDRISASRDAGRKFAAALRVLPLEYEQAVTDDGESGGAAPIVERSLDGEQAALDAAPWLSDAQIAALRSNLDVVRSAPANDLPPDEFAAAVDEAVTAVEATFGLAAGDASGQRAHRVLRDVLPQRVRGLLPAGDVGVRVRLEGQADRELALALKAGDWRVVEARYNGGGFGGAYAAKLAAAAARYAAPGNGSALPRMLRIGDRGEDVKALQLRLPVEVDGIFGPLTDQAVREVQRQHGVAIDGIVGPITRGVLDL